MVQQTRMTRLVTAKQLASAHSQIKLQTECTKAVVYGVLSGILALRTRLPQRAFRRVKLHLDEENLVYKDFIEGDSDTSENGQGIPMLARGKSTRADTLVDLIESSIFPAIEGRYVGTMQLIACKDPKKYSEVVEIWTFSFQYHEDQNDRAVRIESLRIAGSATAAKTAQVTNFGLQQNPRKNIVKLINSTMELAKKYPENNYELKYFILLYFNDKIPSKIALPQFHKKKLPSILRFPVSRKYIRENLEVGAIELGSYSLGMTANLLDFQVPAPHLTSKADTDSVEEYEEETEAPPALRVGNDEYTDVVRKSEEEARALKQLRNRSGTRGLTQEDSNTYTGLQIMALNEESTQNSQLVTTQPSSSTNQIASQSRTLSRATSQVLRLKTESLRKLLLDGNQRNRASEGPLNPNTSEGGKIRDGEGTIVRGRDGRIRSPMNLCSERKDRKASPNYETSVDCLCNEMPEEERDDNTIRCNICLKHQHLDCQGYNGRTDKRVPDLYVLRDVARLFFLGELVRNANFEKIQCYKCLFKEKGNVGALAKLRSLVDRRRVLRKFQRDEAYPLGTYGEVGKVFGMTAKDIEDLSKWFCDQTPSFLTPTEGSKRGGFKDRGLSRWQVAKDKKSETRIEIEAEKQIFAPQKLIEHFYYHPSETTDHDESVEDLLINILGNKSGTQNADYGRMSGEERDHLLEDRKNALEAGTQNGHKKVAKQPARILQTQPSGLDYGPQQLRNSSSPLESDLLRKRNAEDAFGPRENQQESHGGRLARDTQEEEYNGINAKRARVLTSEYSAKRTLARSNEGNGARGQRRLSKTTYQSKRFNTRARMSYSGSREGEKPQPAQDLEVDVSRASSPPFHEPSSRPSSRRSSRPALFNAGSGVADSMSSDIDLSSPYGFEAWLPGVISNALNLDEDTDRSSAIVEEG